MSSELKKYRPVFELNFFESNHHQWNNNFLNEVFFNHFDVSLSFKSFKLTSQYYGMKKCNLF